MIIEVSQNEQNENGSVDILAREIESWKDFRYALGKKMHFSLIRCFLNVDTIRTTSELLSTKVKLFSRIIIYAISIAAAKDDK